MSHWPAAGEHWRPHVRREVTQATVGAEMQNDDPKAAAIFWSDLLDTPALETGPDQFTLPFDNAELCALSRPAMAVATALAAWI
jgi:hypothetical protein